MSQFALADNVKETTTTTLTGTVSLLGAFNTSSKTFVNGIGSTKLTAYKIDDGAGNWECRYGVITSGSPDTITNAGFISSSTGSAISFGAGTKTVTCVPLSELFLTAAISPVLAETDIASATTTDLGSIQTLRARITGTTTITGFGASPNTMRFVRFAGVLTLTHDGTALILPGAANIVTAAGDVALAVSDGSGNWRVLNYTAASTASFLSSTVLLGSAVSLSSNTTADITSLSLPAGDWDVWGTVAYGGSFTGATHINAWIHTVSATIPTIPNGGAYYNDSSGTGATADVNAVGHIRISVAAPTTIYLSTNAVFSGTATAYGFIGARRAR